MKIKSLLVLGLFNLTIAEAADLSKILIKVDPTNIYRCAMGLKDLKSRDGLPEGTVVPIPFGNKDQNLIFIVTPTEVREYKADYSHYDVACMDIPINGNMRHFSEFGLGYLELQSVQPKLLENCETRGDGPIGIYAGSGGHIDSKNLDEFYATFVTTTLSAMKHLPSQISEALNFTEAGPSNGRRTKKQNDEILNLRRFKAKVVEEYCLPLMKKVGHESEINAFHKAMVGKEIPSKLLQLPAGTSGSG